MARDERGTKRQPDKTWHDDLAWSSRRQHVSNWCLLMYVRPPRWSRPPRWPACRSGSVTQMATVHRGDVLLINPPQRQQQHRLPFVFPRHREPQPAPTRDHVAAVRVWWVPDCDSILKFRLSIINRLIHNRLMIMEKFESSILTDYSRTRIRNFRTQRFIFWEYQKISQPTDSEVIVSIFSSLVSN